MPKTRLNPNTTQTRSVKEPARAAAPQARSLGRRVSKEELSRYERETRAQRYILISMGLLAVVIAAILGFGYWKEYIARNSDPVATVAGRPIPLEKYARTLDFRRKSLEQQIVYMQNQLQSLSGNDSLIDLYRQQIQQLQFSEIMLPDQTLDQMIDEELIRQEAARRGISVTPDEIDQETNKTFGDPPTPEAVPSPTSDAGAAATAQPTTEPTVAPAPTADVKARLSQLLSIYGLSEDQYRQMVETQLLYQKLQDAMGAEVPTTADQVHARHILVDSEDKAKELVAKLRDGANFEELAKAESTDTGSKDKGGDLGWFPKGTMVAEFEDAAFQLEPNQISDPVQTGFGWHIIQVLEKEQNRPLDEQALANKKSAALPEWLDKARTSQDVTRSLSQDMKNWVYQRIKWSPPSLPQ